MLSPFDLSPDIFPVVGWLDDAMVMSMLVSELTNMLTIRENQMNLDIDPADVTIDVKATTV